MRPDATLRVTRYAVFGSEPEVADDLLDSSQLNYGSSTADLRYMATAENSARRHERRGIDGWSSTMAAWTVRCLPVALVMAVALLVSVLVVAVLSGQATQVPPSGPPFVTGSITDAARIFGENVLVLILYAMGCVAASIIRGWQTRDAPYATVSKEAVGRIATALVIGLLLLAACRQAYALGHRLAGFSDYFYASRWRLWLGVLPHAPLELTGVFMPVAAWLRARRQGKQRELLALAVAAVLAALPLLAAAALIEVYVSPKAFRALTCIGASDGFRGGGDCGPEPHECPRLSAAEFEERYHIHLSQAERAGARGRCRA